MEALEIFAIVLGVLGVVGSVVPAMPGPPLSWVGMLLLYFAGGCTSTTLFIWLGVTTLITLFDYLFPAWIAKATGGHKEASWGAVIGMIAGIFLAPIGMLAGALAGAFIGEYVFAKNDERGSVKASLGAFLGFVLGTGAKLVASGVMLFSILRYIWIS